MILVMLGTSQYPFTRLINAVSAFAESTGTRVVAQSGHTPAAANLECHAFVDHQRLLEWIASASVVIAQGGYGSLIDSIRSGARTVAVPRLAALGEAMHDQDELVKAFAEEGLVVPVYDIRDLSEAIKSALVMPTKAPPTSSLAAHIAVTISDMCTS